MMYMIFRYVHYVSLCIFHIYSTYIYIYIDTFSNHTTTFSILVFFLEIDLSSLHLQDGALRGVAFVSFASKEPICDVPPWDHIVRGTSFFVP